MALLGRMMTSLGLRARPVSLGGATSSVWAIDDHVLRIGPRERITSELAAAQAASDVVPVPTVVDRVDLDGQSGVLMVKIPGAPAGDLSECTAEQAAERGRNCGRLHKRLSTITPPDAVSHLSEFGDAVSVPSLLHLDLHPWNVLIDAGGEIIAVIDWANASAGPAELDLARTATILTLDPATRQLSTDLRWQALVDGWRETSGWEELPHQAWAWAMKFMLADLSARSSQEDLQPIRRALANLESSV